MNNQPPFAMKLDHATIVTGDLEGARRFLCSIVGLSEGPRPPFGIDGYWLYANGQPAIHLIGGAPASSAPSASARIDHVGLRVNTAQEWTSVLERMRLNGVSYVLSEVALSGESQLFVAMAPGVVIELVIDQHSPRP
jgi:catechol 2,3-dioxygenase-like lactoylglutathione lyase family enzyme